MRRKKQYLILSIVAVSLFVLSILGLILLRLLTHEGELVVLFYIVLALVPVTAILASVLIAKYFAVRISVNSLINENLYSFGERVTFYDMNAF